MATRAISADVKAANSKLAQFLRRQEEEENILQIGKRKPKQVQEERLPGGRGRWKLEPDWKAPTPMVDRPRTIAGATSFHFSYISIAKQGVPTVNGNPVEGSFGQARNPALDHSKYIERDGAAEVSQGADHANYIERPGAAEMLDPAALIAEAHERTIAAIVNETPTPDEAELLGIEAVAPEGIPSVFSNISDDPFERQEFWRAVERCEREPKSHQIILEPDLAPAWWDELETTNLLPDDFKSHALNVKEAYRQYLAEPAPEGRRKKPFEAKPFTVTNERAGRVIEAAQRMASYNPYAPPFEFKSGRGGRIQFRMVAELPHEISAEDRALIVQNFCDHLGGLEERRNLDGTPFKTGMMYTAVIHAPDAHNDSRNYHLHIVAYDRPATYLPEQAQWDFEVQEVYKDPGSRKDRVRYPLRQAKIGEVTQGESKTGKEGSGSNFIPALRGKFAEINNAVLKARGVKRRLDPRKYSEMGIDRTPTQHLGTKAAALEAIGVPTTVGQLNALAIWSDAERAIRFQAVQAAKSLNAAQQELDKLAQAVTKADPRNASLAALRPLLVERQRLIADVADDREAIMTFDHMEAKAKSRAFRARQTCSQFLAEIEAGTAARSVCVIRTMVEGRWQAAQQHIENINAALAPHREALAEAARNIKSREQRICEIDMAIHPIRSALYSNVETWKNAAGQPRPTHPAADLSAASSLQRNDARQELVEPASAATPERPQFAMTQPVRIEGLEIIDATLPPPVDQPIEQPGGAFETPDGLEPLRSTGRPKHSHSEEQLITKNIGLPNADNASLAGDRGPLRAIDECSPDAPNQVNKEERAKDGVPEPVKASAQKTDEQLNARKFGHAEFDELISRISSKRLPINAIQNNDGTITFIVPSLGDDDRRVIGSPRFAKRANVRLEAIHKHQQLELQRLVRWIDSTGRDPCRLKLENRSAMLGKEVSESAKTLFGYWGSHTLVRKALSDEFDRRTQLSATVDRQVKQGAQVGVSDREAVKAKAASRYPEPKQAFTQEVEDFINLLLAGTSNDKLAKAAAKIDANPRAREDIRKHNVHLETAYARHLPGSGHPSPRKVQGRSR